METIICTSNAGNCFYSRQCQHGRHTIHEGGTEAFTSTQRTTLLWPVVTKEQNDTDGNKHSVHYCALSAAGETRKKYWPWFQHCSEKSEPMLMACADSPVLRNHQLRHL